MSGQPTLSVIVPVRDGARYLAEALQSILHDVPAPLEVVVVDDGSSDESAALAEAIGEPVRVLRTPPRGVSAARNTGVAQARGELLAFLDADDLWITGRSAAQLALLRHDPAADGVIGQTQRIARPPHDAGPTGDFEAIDAPWPALSVGALMLRRVAFERVGPFDEARSMSEDVDWLLRAKEAGLRIEPHHDLVQHYRRHEHNVTNHVRADRRGFVTALRDAIARRDRPAAQPPVSVLICVRNGERYLPQALDSIRAQTLPPAEVVLLDGGSTDGTLQIAAGYPEVRVVHQQGTGIAEAYNQGIAACTHDVLAFLSCDDRWLPDKLEQQVRWLQRHPDHLYVGGHAHYQLEPGMDAPRGFRPELVDAVRPAFMMETLCMRRETFERVGPFDASIPVGEDVDWFGRARDLGLPCGMVPQKVVLKRIHGGNATLDLATNRAALLALARKAAARKRQARGAEGQP